ncbi:DNA-directed RNA polymerase subunit alpha [Candidatus Gottesmanbacteria bacterium RIFCSPHIGHO2_01_FULL_39_10]|uniref:DNA-directed RNA polymerase subunit alpha n=1 Tax=Candidatus Gottesmanbacteria bacterium RIFCSPHIGHO2_01_FULL_39_10 TaxID=1798375 RepID=A0A1F5ZRF4_9BACT|nr:MAG: DNA-directed RNA polymerase subunit alpha [Candidatus Gottesmanbacteria bacterium RIFCSPHIGHO2_01_FULL_39_10]
MLEPNFKVKVDKETESYGKFIIEPLEQGFGHTLGVSLRRVLLTSLKGAAVTKVRINGVKHQFSTLPGLKEDIVEILLNIKKLRFKLTSDKATTLKIAVKGPKKFYAKDLEGDGSVDVVNQDLYLGELTTAKAKFEAELTIEPGYGYVTRDEKEVGESIGTMLVDSLFTPVTRVNYKIEATRVGRMTDLDRLIVEIWTDGTTSPSFALKDAARTLVSYFLQIYEPKAVVSEGVAVAPSVSDEVLKMTLEELDLPTRIVNALHIGGIDTVGQLLGTPRKELLRIKNLGAKSISVIDEILRQKGVALNV